MKDHLLRQIRQIYRDLHYRPYGKPLEEYREEELREHLEKLQAGAYPWMRKPTDPPRECAVLHH